RPRAYCTSCLNAFGLLARRALLLLLLFFALTLFPLRLGPSTLRWLRRRRSLLNLLLRWWSTLLRWWSTLRLSSTLLLEALILRPPTARGRSALRLSSTLLLEALILRGLTALWRRPTGCALRPTLALLEALVLRGLTALRRRPTGCALRPTLEAFLRCGRR